MGKVQDWPWCPTKAGIQSLGGFLASLDRCTKHHAWGRSNDRYLFLTVMESEVWNQDASVLRLPIVPCDLIWQKEEGTSLEFLS